MELIEAEGIEVEVWDRSRVEPTADSFQAAADFAVRRFRRVRRGRRRVEHRHGEGLRPHSDAWRRDHGLRQRPHRRRQEAAGTLAAAAGHPDYRRHRCRGDDGRYPGHPRPEGEDRDIAPVPAPQQGHSGPLAHDDHAPEVTSSCGLDVVCHAAESYLAKPYDARPKPESPDDRPPYQGANPIADMWSAKALEYGGKYLRRAVDDGEDVEARGAMMLGASLAGVGFGSAGVHIPHACAYPIAGLKQMAAARLP